MSRVPWSDILAAIATLTFLVSGLATRAIGQELAPPRPGESTFEVELKRFAFEPERLEVTAGDYVRIVARSADGTHGFAIRKLKVKREIPRGGEPVTIEFVANEPGEYEITCSEYCGTGHAQMKGYLVVKPALKNGSGR